MLTRGVRASLGGPLVPLHEEAEVRPMPEARHFADARFMTVAEVADVMRVSKMTVYRLVHSGELPAVQFGRSYRVPESAVEQFLGSARIEYRESGTA